MTPPTSFSESQSLESSASDSLLVPDDDDAIADMLFGGSAEPVVATAALPTNPAANLPCTARADVWVCVLVREHGRVETHAIDPLTLQWNILFWYISMPVFLFFDFLVSLFDVIFVYFR